jgi:hypothetical protein
MNTTDPKLCYSIKGIHLLFIYLFNSGSILGRGKKFFSSSQHPDLVWRPPSLYKMGTRSLRGKGHDSDHSPPTSFGEWWSYVHTSISYSYMPSCRALINWEQRLNRFVYLWFWMAQSVQQLDYWLDNWGSWVQFLPGFEHSFLLRAFRPETHPGNLGPFPVGKSVGNWK